MAVQPLLTSEGNMALQAKHFEVERKYRVGEHDFPGIAQLLAKMRFSKSSARQKDTYLTSPAEGVNRRVRKERVKGSSPLKRYYLTCKRKVQEGGVANEEDEVSISKETYRRLADTEPLISSGMSVVVRKGRVHFRGSFEGRAVTVCLDRVWGSGGFDLGFFVELEVLVKAAQEIEDAHELLSRLRQKILPASAIRERRGYRSLVLEQIRNARPDCATTGGEAVVVNAEPGGTDATVRGAID